MEKSATSEVSELIGGQFDWRTLPTQTGSLNKRARNRILGIREDYLASIERTNSIRDRFPERWLAPLLGIDPWPSLIGEGEAVSSEATIVKTPIHPILSFILMWLFAAIASLGCFLATSDRLTARRLGCGRAPLPPGGKPAPSIGSACAAGA